MSVESDILSELCAESMASDAREARIISITMPLQSQQMAITGPFIDAALERLLPPSFCRGTTADWERDRDFCLPLVVEGKGEGDFRSGLGARVGGTEAGGADLWRVKME